MKPELTILTGTEMIRRFCNYERDAKLKEIRKDEKKFVTFELHGKSFLYQHGEKIFPGEDEVCLVLKNGDFTEGRGPMSPHKLFRTFEAAVAYILTEPGIYGSPQYVSTNVGVNIYGEPYGYTSLNGYDIKIMRFED